MGEERGEKERERRFGKRKSNIMRQRGGRRITNGMQYYFMRATYKADHVIVFFFTFTFFQLKLLIKEFKKHKYLSGAVSQTM